MAALKSQNIQRHNLLILIFIWKIILILNNLLLNTTRVNVEDSKIVQVLEFTLKSKIQNYQITKKPQATKQVPPTEPKYTSNIPQALHLHNVSKGTITLVNRFKRMHRSQLETHKKMMHFLKLFINLLKIKIRIKRENKRRIIMRIWMIFRLLFRSILSMFHERNPPKI